MKAPERIWALGGDKGGDWGSKNGLCHTFGGTEYIRADLHEAEIARLTAERDAALAGLVKVKPLVWEYSETTYTADRETGRQELSGLFWQANTILMMGRFTIMRLVDARIKGDRESYRLDIRGKEQRFQTLEAAKAAAQADYEARILAALEPQPITVQDAARGAKRALIMIRDDTGHICGVQFIASPQEDSK